MSLPHAPLAIGQIAVHVEDLPRAVGFYRDVLGLPLLFEAPPSLAFFDCGGVRLMLSGASEPGFDHPASILYYRVADIVAAHAALRERGATFVDEPHVVHRTERYALWMTFLRDTEGNTLALMEERTEA
ncbi:MAG: VOC family protein [Gemmatimonadota bacterium]|nr:VOC family protein [Gemmatimonadota bacterium]